MIPALWFLALGLGSVPQEDEVDRLLSLLGVEDAAIYAETLDELKSLGEVAALRALETFDGVDFRERRARARVLVDAVSPACIPPIIDRLRDDDPLVRRLLCRALGAFNLGSAEVPRRVQALAERATQDASLDVRREAVSALSKTGSAAAVGVLDRLLDELPPGERAHCARALVDLPAARVRLCARVISAFEEPLKAPSDTVLAVLLDEYGKALADLPVGGEAPRERVPFVAARHHQDPEVATATRRTLDRALARMVEFGELERADLLLEGLAAEGLDPREMFYRRADLALTESGDAQATLQHARSLQRAARGARPEESGRWLLFGELYAAIAQFGAGRIEQAYKGFGRAAQRAQQLFSERTDLQPDPWAEEPSKYGGSLAVDRLQLAGVIELWSAVTYLDRGDSKTWLQTVPDARALRHLRQAHVFLLRARVMAERTDSPLGSVSWDSLIDRNLSPYRLVLTRSKVERFRGGHGLRLAHRLGRAIASVAWFEMPGFEPFEGVSRTLADPLYDQERRGLLVELRDEERRSLRRRLDKLRRQDVRDRNTESRLVYYLSEIRRIEEEERVSGARAFSAGEPSGEELLSIYSGLARYLQPSGFALSLADFMRIEGMAQEARGLAERALRDYAGGLPGSGALLTELMSAQLELSIGATLMDEFRPQEAEEAFLGAARRLEAFENTLTEMRAETEPGSMQAARFDAQLRQTRALRAQVLLSLAVNANVRLQDPDKALGYFEGAYELDKREFMRILLACYRARSGREEEARGVLMGIDSRPAFYYNLACTYALLGEVGLALDYLARDFEENHRTRGSRLRQVEWAREDPDLANLRSDPRFERLLSAAESK